MRRARPIALALALAAAAGCASERGGLRELEGGVEVGLRRGSAWSTLKVRPPHVIGPRATLRLGKGEFSGTIDGRPVHLRVEEGGVSGSGPAGQVAVDIVDGPSELLIEGTWNGARVHFKITSDSFRGSIAVYQGRTFDEVFFCQYVLDRVEPDGARTGTSICEGMPEDTRVEVPAKVQSWLTRQELVVVLLTLFSAPPFTSVERR